MANLNGKTAVVTGASKGIGAAIAKTLGAAGASVVVNYASDKAGADKVVQSIGPKALAVQGDVAKSADVTRLFAETKKAFGEVNIVVNNAGIFRFGPLEQFTEEDFHRQFNTNVLGTLLVTAESLKHFSPEGGSVVNVSSVVSTNPAPSSVVYSATKAAVDSITRSLANELGPRRIRVNAVNPGLTVTEGVEEIGFHEGEFGENIARSTPLGRLGKSEDIAQTVLFLASDESAWITGETLRSSGGLK